LNTLERTLSRLELYRLFLAPLRGFEVVLREEEGGVKLKKTQKKFQKKIQRIKKLGVNWEETGGMLGVALRFLKIF